MFSKSVVNLENFVLKYDIDLLMSQLSHSKVVDL